MDQRTAAIDQDLKDIVETRIDIAEKIELLEQRIKDTAEGATMKFSRMLNEGTESVTHLVDNTKAALDPIHKVDDYPWLMLGGRVRVAVGSAGAAVVRPDVCLDLGGLHRRLADSPSYRQQCRSGRQRGADPDVPARLMLGQRKES